MVKRGPRSGSSVPSSSVTSRSTCARSCSTWREPPSPTPQLLLDPGFPSLDLVLREARAAAVARLLGSLRGIEPVLGARVEPDRASDLFAVRVRVRWDAPQRLQHLLGRTRR